jgi:hypothetical protein
MLGVSFLFSFSISPAFCAIEGWGFFFDLGFVWLRACGFFTWSICERSFVDFYLGSRWMRSLWICEDEQKLSQEFIYLTL